jgi:chromosome segregation ATPase
VNTGSDAQTLAAGRQASAEKLLSKETSHFSSNQLLGLFGVIFAVVMGAFGWQLHGMSASIASINAGRASDMATINAGMASVNGRIDAIMVMFNERFNAIDRKFNDIDRKFNDMDQKINEIDRKYDRKIDSIQESISNLRGEITRIQAHLSLPPASGPNRMPPVSPGAADASGTGNPGQAAPSR